MNATNTPTITPELTAAALRYWYGDRGTATEGATWTRRSSDGGSYTLAGTRIQAYGDFWGIVYTDDQGGVAVEFSDGAAGRIVDNGDGSWTFHGMGGDAVICPADTAGTLECRTGLCGHGARPAGQE